MTGRLSRLLATDRKLLSIYLTAGFPAIDSAAQLLPALAAAGVDFVELGFPFSDPVADGPIIQRVSQRALENGMTMKRLLEEQLPEVMNKETPPPLLMGYFNPVLQYGLERFIERASALGVEGAIIPDLPLDVYRERVEPLLRDKEFRFVFLATPDTPEERLREIESSSGLFLYLVSRPGTTGVALSLDELDRSFERFARFDLRVPVIVGFGISDAASYSLATRYFNGAIIGSAFLKSIEQSTGRIAEAAREFVEGIRS